MTFWFRRTHSTIEDSFTSIANSTWAVAPSLPQKSRKARHERSETWPKRPRQLMQAGAQSVQESCYLVPVTSFGLPSPEPSWSRHRRRTAHENEGRRRVSLNLAYPRGGAPRGGM